MSQLRCNSGLKHTNGLERELLYENELYEGHKELYEIFKKSDAKLAAKCIERYIDTVRKAYLAINEERTGN